jgi:glycosyltransferase involved in cell wall biosynthesis
VLEAFLQRPDIQAEFLVLGDGPERERVQDVAARDPRIKAWGHVRPAELENALLQTDIFVFPSYYEGFGLALLEAMASGHACVCYDVPAVRELLGGGGVLVPPGDATLMVEEISRLVKDSARLRSYLASGHQLAARFSWRHACEAIDHIIRETVAEYEARPVGVPIRAGK